MIGPNAGRIDDGTGLDHEITSIDLVATHDFVDATRWTVMNVNGTDVVGRDGVEIEDCGASERERDSRVVTPGVHVEESSDELLGLERGEMSEDFALRDSSIAGTNAPATGEVIDSKRGRVTSREGFGNDAVATE